MFTYPSCSNFSHQLLNLQIIKPTLILPRHLGRPKRVETANSTLYKPCFPSLSSPSSGAARVKEYKDSEKGANSQGETIDRREKEEMRISLLS
jgi:hypothetical protein